MLGWGDILVGIGINWKGTVSSDRLSIVFSDGRQSTDWSRCASLIMSSLSPAVSCISCIMKGKVRLSVFLVSEIFGVGICIGGVRGGARLEIFLCL